MRIIGTNPSVTLLSVAIPNNLLKQIARHESSLRQFHGYHGSSACPYFSEDTYGGVGLFQITRPRPTPDETWDWRANLAQEVSIFDEKQTVARAYPKLCRSDVKFKSLADDFIELQKENFVAAKKKANPNATPAELVPPAFSVVLPDYTDEELYDDTIRGFNGYGGPDSLGHTGRLHEFEVPTKLDSDSGNLQLDAKLDSDGKTATLKWRRVSIDRRRKERHDDDGNVVYDKKGQVIRDPIGDPNYVYNVKRQPLF